MIRRFRNWLADVFLWDGEAVRRDRMERRDQAAIYRESLKWRRR
jgi:hypothetical protein